jgi:hypothetical protein
LAGWGWLDSTHTTLTKFAGFGVPAGQFSPFLCGLSPNRDEVGASLGAEKKEVEFECGTYLDPLIWHVPCTK